MLTFEQTRPAVTLTQRFVQIDVIGLVLGCLLAQTHTSAVAGLVLTPRTAQLAVTPAHRQQIRFPFYRYQLEQILFF